ncbi:MAG: hypothetical protein ACK40O_04850 [Allosphingosinicella sp.]
MLKSVLLAALMLAGAPAAAAPNPPPGDRSAAGDEALRTAAEAIDALDIGKLYDDKTYAAAILGHAERIAAAGKDDPDVRMGMGNVRMLALTALERVPEALALGQALIAAGETNPFTFGIAASAAGAAGDRAAALAALEAGARAMQPDEGEPMRAFINEDLVQWMFGSFYEAKDKASQRRLSEALLTIGWPDPDDIDRRDWYRLDAIDRRLESGDIAGARALALEVKGAAPTVRLATARRYYDLFEAGEDPVALVESALARGNRHSRERLEAEPDNLKRLLTRAQTLREMGKEEQALALLLPATADLAAVETGGEDAFWIVNEAAYSLQALGRSAEAVALMEKLLTLDMKKHGSLVNMAINHGAVLIGAGRYEEAARYSEALEARVEGLASPFGKMWIWSSAACGHALGGDMAAAAPALARLKEGSETNEAAHMRALLCADDMDAAETLLIRRLRGDDPHEVLAALQDYTVGEHRTEAGRLIAGRLQALRARPAVAAEIAKVGRILPLPLSKIYWGDF